MRREYDRHRQQARLDRSASAARPCSVCLKFLSVSTGLRRTAEQMRLKHAQAWPCQDTELSQAVEDLHPQAVLVLSPDAEEPITAIHPGENRACVRACVRACARARVMQPKKRHQRGLQEQCA